MVTPAWVRNKRYRVYRSPGTGQARVVHYSPSTGHRTTILVPATHASNIPTYLRKFFANANIRARKNVKIPVELNCNVKNSLYQNSTNNGRTGHVLASLNMTTTNLRTKYNSSKGLKRIRKGMALLGSGKQGIVFLACPTRSCKQHIVIKVSPHERRARTQIPLVEFNIQKKVFKVAPTHIAVPYNITTCVNFAPVSDFKNRRSSYDYTHQYVFFSEYCSGGDLDDWLDKVAPRLRDVDMASMIHQILAALKKIQGKYPGFRHNDLHLKNILVDDQKSFPRLVISDFGFARLTPTGSNPVVDSGEFRMYGITSRTDMRYDSHLFLNALRIHIRRHPRFSRLYQTLAFLDRAVPPGYRNGVDKYVYEARLKDLRAFPGLPTITQLLADPFLRTARNSPTRSVSSPRINLTSSRSPRTPMSSRNAADIAQNLLANIPGVSITAGGAPAMTPRALLNSYTQNKNMRLVTKRQLKKHLTNQGVRPANAKAAVNTWTNRWVASRRNVNRATSILKGGGNLNRFGYPPNVAAVAKRRVTLKLSKSPGRGRVRKNKTLLMSKKRDELVQLARNAGVPHSGRTKQQLINALYG